MLIEKLFLNILIVLAPTLVLTAIGDKWRFVRSSFGIGLFQGLSSILCMLFSYQIEHYYWDLRYVPLMISTIYGGPTAGAVIYLFIIANRTYLGGPALIVGYIYITLVFVFVWFASRKIVGLTGKYRMRGTLMISFIPFLVLLGFSVIVSNQIPMSSIISFGFFQVLACYFSAMIFEVFHERIVMKQEIQQNEKLKTLGQLAASMAHEVRNPLTVVNGFLQMMRPHQNGKNVNYLDIAMGELERTEAIIKDYLFFAKPKLTKVESFSLTDLVDNVITLYTPMATNNGVVLSSNLQDDIVIETDRGQLQQALINVIKNAVEATPSEGMVSICLTGHDHYAQIVIMDNGKGMTKEQTSRIGTLFFTTKEVGTGIGTALAFSIIESMHGQIKYESELGVGTTVTITVQYRAVVG